MTGATDLCHGSHSGPIPLQEVIKRRMRCPKSVTPRKLEANRSNAKRSTGPRTERGKQTAKFNAVTLGLFAKHVVIPVHDGYKAERDFRALLDQMHEEFCPVGVYEEWLVVKIAESMWRLRRATRCERGAVRDVSMIARGSDQEIDIFPLISKLCTLRKAQEQLQQFGTLSQEFYSEFLPIVEEERREQMRSEAGNRPVVDFDKDEFLSCISERKRGLEVYYEGILRLRAEKDEAVFDLESLPQEVDLQRIFRYEDRMLRQIDWAVDRLLERQHRKESLSSTPPALCSAEAPTKRSQ